jgi:hypothetical protein
MCKFLAKSNAAEWCLSILKYNDVDMYHSTTVTLFANTSQNTTVYLIAKQYKKLFATNIANTNQNTTGSIPVEITLAQLHAHLDLQYQTNN